MAETCRKTSQSRVYSATYHHLYNHDHRTCTCTLARTHAVAQFSAFTLNPSSALKHPRTTTHAPALFPRALPK